jgi:hypothetical protein
MQEKPNKPAKPFIKGGAGAHYTRTDILAESMGCTLKGLHTLLASLGDIPRVHFPGTGDYEYVLTYAFESALFTLGMPKPIREREDLCRLHQELAGVLYGTLTKEALRERVKSLVKSLTSAGDKATIGRRKRKRSDHRTWSGRKPSG